MLISYITVICACACLISADTKDEDLYKDEAIFTNLTRGYDKRILPTTNGTPVRVEIVLNIYNFAETKSIYSHYSMEVVMHMTWTDERLKFNGSEVDDLRLVAKSTTLIWTPDITFEEKVGRRSQVTTDNSFAVIESNGFILLSQRLMLTMFCPMNFTTFPFDEQICTLPVMSYSYNNKLLILDWYKDNARTDNVGAVFKFDGKSGNFDLEKFSTSKIKRDFGFTGVHDTLTLTMHFQRKFFPYFVRLYLPLILIVLLSFASFWIDYRSSPARTIMSTTIFLTAMMFIVGLQATLPPTTSIRSIDLYSLGCFLFVFATLAEFAAVQTVDIRVKLRKKMEKRLKAKDDKLKNNSTQQVENNRSTRVSPTSKDTPPINAATRQRKPSLYQRAVEKIYTEHQVHQNEYHVLDRISKKVFPIAFALMNAIYFIVYYYISLHDH